jgi:hypothetical protein
MARGMDQVFRTIVDRTRSRLDVPALRTPFRIRWRPEGTGQPSPKLFADRKPKAATGYQEQIGAGLVPMGTGVLAGPGSCPEPAGQRVSPSQAP